MKLAMPPYTPRGQSIVSMAGSAPQTLVIAPFAASRKVKEGVSAGADAALAVMAIYAVFTQVTLRGW